VRYALRVLAEHRHALVVIWRHWRQREDSEKAKEA
jgi:hypothetical protein